MDEQDVRQDVGRRRGGRIGAGVLLLLIGGVLLLDQMNFPLPDYLFNWHVLLIVIGLWIGLRHNFRGGGWFILIAVGGFFMLQDYYPDTHIHRFIWPGVLIFVGLMVILRPNRSRWQGRWSNEWRQDWEKHRAHWRYGNPNHPGNPGNPGNPAQPGGSTQAFGSQRQSYSSEDFVDATSIFGGVHKKVMSKNFKGGDITTILGGTEIDLSQADFTGVARLDVTQVMGGTKIIVPPHWEVRSEVSAIFAGFEDKRQQPAASNPDKVLIIDGTSIFGGIELKNY